jgi:hypothetical protein
MKYAYEDLHPGQFEILVTLICQELLGISVQGFATGPDGGRDARFEGTARLFPSDVDPWKGRVVIQAKHTNGLNKSFTESDFYSATSKTSVVAREIPRIVSLKTSGELDHYMLFSNRRLTGNGDSEIRRAISSACGVSTASIYLCGIEQIELWLKQFRQIPDIAGIDPVDSPLIVSPEDIAEIVAAFAKHRVGMMSILDDPPISRVDLAAKDRLNGMSGDYSKTLRRMYLKDTEQIRQFLAAPENDELLNAYESAVDEFQLRIITHRKDYQSFDQVMNYLIDLLFDRDPILRQRQHKRLTRALLFYMYWNCDIGSKGDDNVETDETLAS